MNIRSGLAGLFVLSAAVTVAQAPKGYLDSKALPDLAPVLAAPPAPDTPAHAADLAAYAAAGQARGGASWLRATDQLDPFGPKMLGHVSCALGVALDPKSTPATVRLLHRAAMDAELTASRAKSAFKRPRPYASEPGPVACDPRSVGATGSTSYPSGSASSGWLWGLILADLAPTRATQALRLGAEIGDNRVACRVHYPSDVMAGRMVGSAVYVSELKNVAFRADLEAARAEIAKAPSKAC